MKVRPSWRTIAHVADLEGNTTRDTTSDSSGDSSGGWTNDCQYNDDGSYTNGYGQPCCGPRTWDRDKYHLLTASHGTPLRRGSVVGGQTQCA